MEEIAGMPIEERCCHLHRITACKEISESVNRISQALHQWAIIKSTDQTLTAEINQLFHSIKEMTMDGSKPNSQHNNIYLDGHIPMADFVKISGNILETIRTETQIFCCYAFISWPILIIFQLTCN